jgi:hypothetical protein
MSFAARAEHRKLPSKLASSVFVKSSEDVEIAEALLDLVEHPVDLLLLGDRGAQDLGSRADSLEFRLRVLRLAVGMEAVDQYIGAALAQLTRDHFADALAPAGNQRKLAREVPHVATVALKVGIGTVCAASADGAGTPKRSTTMVGLERIPLDSLPWCSIRSMVAYSDIAAPL